MRYRWWYHATGLPGWMRFGPGWGGPCAWYAMTGQWPVPPPAWEGPAPDREAELSTLKTEAEWLKAQLDAITKRIEELGTEG
jgi:hypothetical protein